jgi:Leucine-rich repeat (LRR) protein
MIILKNKLLPIVLFACMALTIAPTPVHATETRVEINLTNFSDNTFRNYVKKFDKDQDGSLSASEIRAVKEIDVEKEGIRSLDGISYFTSLTELNCSGNRLTSLNISKNKKLKELDCSDNKLTSLNVSKNTRLKELDCSSNRLTSLNVSNNTNLKELDCSDNKLTSLDVSKNTNLEELDCSDNRISKLDLSKNDALKAKELDCDKTVTLKR